MAKNESELLAEHFRDVGVVRTYQKRKEAHDKKYVLRKIHETTIHPKVAKALKKLIKEVMVDSRSYNYCIDKAIDSFVKEE